MERLNWHCKNCNRRIDLWSYTGRKDCFWEHNEVFNQISLQFNCKSPEPYEGILYVYHVKEVK